LLLRDRAYPLWQRLFILGMFSKRLHEITVGRQLGLVPQLLREYGDLLAQGTLRGAMDGIPVRNGAQLAIVLEIIDRQLGMTDVSHTGFRERVQEFLDGIHYRQDSPIEGCVTHYEQAHVDFFHPFMQQHPFIMENYLVNYVFRTRFPYGVDAQGKENDALTEYLTMCLLYSVVKALLIGVAGHYGAAFSSDHVVKVVQTFAKAVEQCADFSVTKYKGLANADGMALLLKNSNETSDINCCAETCR
jgi:lysine-N-methylase